MRALTLEVARAACKQSYAIRILCHMLPLGSLSLEKWKAAEMRVMLAHKVYKIVCADYLLNNVTCLELLRGKIH